MKKLFITILVLALFLTVSAPAQDPAQKAQDPAPAAAEQDQAPKTWPVTKYQAAHLQRLIDEFNKLWENTLTEIKTELKEKYKGYEDMPIADVILDLQNGYFITRGDYEALQKKAAEAAAAPIKKDPEDPQKK